MEENLNNLRYAIDPFCNSWIGSKAWLGTGSMVEDSTYSSHLLFLVG